MYNKHRNAPDVITYFSIMEKTLYPAQQLLNPFSFSYAEILVVNNFEIWKESGTFEIVTSEGGFSSEHGIVHAGFRGLRTFDS